MYISPYINSGEQISVMGDFFRIIHVRNAGLAFSLGASFPNLLKRVAYVFFPLALLTGLGVFLLRDKQLKMIQRWALACIIGGGIGNIIDRVFREGLVVDFLDFKFFGLFGMERWPTFNVADSAVVIGVFLFILGGIIGNKIHK
ncbi:hypothetical protein LSH36_1091g00174 [Paralvinella palmiformis]|uniref:Signal peptidase II n=1 Tax=Paralvinella palmiformis TaxID=53620 RepID=A0AAD9IVL9_9ANNE|nr:hypothetical protein LSH36_1091g00174 [Paralvinella palmiformis]